MLFAMTRREFCAALAVAGSQRIFNSRDLTGWRKAGHGLWTVEDGAITGRFDTAHPGPGYLFSEHEYGNFELRLEFWISKRGNSGVYVRQPWRQFGTKGDERPAHSPGDGVEVQID